MIQEAALIGNVGTLTINGGAAIAAGTLCGVAVGAGIAIAIMK
jgi:hypothetical protein